VVSGKYLAPKKFQKKLALFTIVTMIVTIMAINTQFPIAVHLMAALGYRSGRDTTSAQLATSVNTSPSFVRRTLAKLSRAGLVETATGKAGACWLAKDAKNISLLDIYRAVDAPKAFSIHHYTEQKACPVSCHIKEALDKALAKTQKAMERSLDDITLEQIVSQVNRN
jgi:Rrf2 family protein